MMHGIREGGVVRSIGMPGTGRDRYFRIKSLFTASFLKRRPVL